MEKRHLWVVGAASVAIALLLIAAGTLYYRTELRHTIAERSAELHTIGQLKTDQIEAWRAERLNDVRVCASSLSFAFGPRTANSRANVASDPALREHLETFRTTYGYENVAVVGLDGNVLVSLDPRLTHVDSETLKLAAHAIANGGATFGELFRCPICGQVHLDVAAPVLDATDRPRAAIILRSDPDRYGVGMVPPARSDDGARPRPHRLHHRDSARQLGPAARPALPLAAARWRLRRRRHGRAFAVRGDTAAVGW